MASLFSIIGMILLSAGLTIMGYGPTTIVWWLIFGGMTLYSVGWKLVE